MNLSPKYLIKLLQQNGYIFKRASGSHRLYYNPTSRKTVIVPYHGGKDMKKGAFLAILRQAWISMQENI